MNINKAQILEDLKNHRINNIPEELINDFDFTLQLVEHSGILLHLASHEFKKNSQIVLAAIKENHLAIVFADKSLYLDKDIMLTAINYNGFSLQFTSPELRDDYDIVLKAVSNNGDALAYVSERLFNNITIVLSAIKSSISCLYFANEIFQNDYVILCELKKRKKELKQDDFIQEWFQKRMKYLDTLEQQKWMQKNIPVQKAKNKSIKF